MSILRPVTLLRRALLLGLLLALPSAPALAQVPSTTTTTKPPQLGTGSSDDLILSPQGALPMYKEGPAGIVNFVLGARDLEDASTRLGYVKRVLDFDRNTLDRLDAAQKDYSARSSRLDELKSEKLSAVGRVEGVRREIAGNLERQQKARDAAAAEAQHKRSVLAK